MVVEEGFLRTGRKQTPLLSLRLDSKEMTGWSALPHYLGAWQSKGHFTLMNFMKLLMVHFSISLLKPLWMAAQPSVVSAIPQPSFTSWQLPEGTLHPIILVHNEEVKWYLFSCDFWGTPLVTVLQLNLMLHGFMKGKLSLTSLIVLYKEMTESGARGECWILFISNLLRLLALP